MERRDFLASVLAVVALAGVAATALGNETKRAEFVVEGMT